MDAAEPIRVLFLDHTAKLGGGEIALANLVGQLANDSTIEPRAILFEDGPLVARLKTAGCPTRVVPLSDTVRAAKKGGVGLSSLAKVPAAIGFVRRLARAIREERADLVYCNTLKADVLGGLAARMAGVPCIWHVRDRVMPDYLPAKVVPVFRRLCRLVPQGVAANSEHTLETVRLGGRKPSRVVYSGVVPPDEVADEPEGDGFGDDVGGPGGPVVGIVGRLAAWKGQDVFLEAAAIVRRELPQVRFRIIGSALFGEDDVEAALRERAGRGDLAGHVEFAGFADDVWGALAKLTLVVHASTTPEPFGQVVVEAMAARRAVVATDAGGVRETVVDGETGLLVPPGDAEAMAAAMVRLLRDPEERQQMAAAGRERALSHFHIEQTSQACVKLIQDVLRRGDEAGG